MTHVLVYRFDPEYACCMESEHDFFDRLKIRIAEISTLIKFIAAEVASVVGFLLVVAWGLAWEFRHLFFFQK